MPIKTAVDLLDEWKQRRPDLVPPDQPDPGARLVLELRRLAGQPIPEPATGPPVGPPVLARVDHGRWMGDCDLQDVARKRVCRSAQYLHPDDRRLYCSTCTNQAVGGRWRPVLWPADRAAVEAPLGGLPPREQNWRP
jgi:hypothetical protein